VISAITQAGRRDLGLELIHVSTTDPEAEIRGAAFDALRNLGVKDAVPAALDGLGDENQFVRTAAMQLVGELGEAEVASMIRPRTSDYEPMVRAASARALGQIQARDAQPELARLLRDPVPEVRAAAADGVSDGGGAWAVPELLKLLVDSDPHARRSAAHALGRVGDAAILPALTRAFQTGSADLREVIADSVARIDVNALPALLDILMESSDLQSRLATVRILGRIQSPASAGLLEIVWKDREPAVRSLAVDALVQLGGDRSEELLTQGLTDPDDEVRSKSVEALARFGATGAGPRILELLTSDPSPRVRERAALATGLLRVPGGDTALLAACHSEEPLNVRAAAALGIGAYDKESIVAQVLSMLDEDPVREFLRERLQHDPGFRQIRQRLRDAQQVELRALGSLNREQMEASLVEGMRGVLDPRERVRLVSAIQAFRGERSRRALVYAVRSDPSPDVRAAALAAVADMLDPDELLLAARRAVTDPHPAVRRVAVTLFSRMDPEQALPMLVKLLRAEDDDPVVLQAVARHAETAFHTFVDLTMGAAPGSHEGIVVARVARFINHPDLPMLLGSIGRSTAPEAREELAVLWRHRPELMSEEGLAALSGDPVASVRIAAVHAWGASRRYDRLAQFFEDPEADVRRMAALELAAARNGPDPAALLRDVDERVRAAAWGARMLRGGATDLPPDIGRETAAAALREIMPAEQLQATARTHPEPARRLAAGVALALMDDPVAREVAGKDPETRVREQVGRALGPARSEG
jgi:HEAT repeat protein